MMNLNDVVTEELFNVMNEDYPSSFDMDEFKTLSSFKSRKEYCDQHLQKIKAGSSRIVYKIDNEKVLKLAFNKKGLAQNEVEVDYSSDPHIDNLVAKVFDSHDDYYWHEMELARKLTKPEFKKIIGIDFDTYSEFIISNYYKNDTRRGGGHRVKTFSQEIHDFMWEESEFGYDILSFIGNYNIAATDLGVLSAYGIVKRDGQDTVVIIDYGLTDEVFASHYRK